MRYLIFLILWLGAGLVMALEPNARPFEFDGKVVRFSHLEFGQAHFIGDGSGSVIVPFASLSKPDQLAVVELSGWGREWNSKCGRFSVIADQVSCTKKHVTLEKATGQLIDVEIEQLSLEDRAFVETFGRPSLKTLPPNSRGKAIKVFDGESFTMLHNWRTYQVRIGGVDAPEFGQDYSQQAKTMLDGLVVGNVVTCVRKNSDHQGKNVCAVKLDGADVGDQMLQSGLAWVAKSDRNLDSQRMAIETSSILKRTNIWSQSAPVAPWDWRDWSSEIRTEYRQIAVIAAERAGRNQPANRLESPTATSARRSGGESGSRHTKPEPIPYSRNLVWIASYVTLDGQFVIGKWVVCLESDRLRTSGFSRSSEQVSRQARSYSITSLPPLQYNGPVHVRGYYRKDGTYVRPHTRSRPSR